MYEFTVGAILFDGEVYAEQPASDDILGLTKFWLLFHTIRTIVRNPQVFSGQPAKDYFVALNQWYVVDRPQNLPFTYLP